MTNPYRKYSDHLGVLIKNVSREHLYDVEPSSELNPTGGAINFVALMGTGTYEEDLDTQLMHMFKDLGEDDDAS